MGASIKSKWREAAGQWLERHPVLAIILALCSFFFIFLPQWGSSVWQLFSDKPFFVWLPEKMKAAQLTFSPNWITAPVGLLAIFFIVYLLLTGRHKAKVDESQADGTARAVIEMSVDDVNELERRIKDLQVEITSLEHDGEVADRTIQRLKAEVERFQESAETHSMRAAIRDNELETLKTKYEWLDEIVEYQRNGLRKYVLVEKCDINHSHLSDGKRYVEFTFNIVNYSMFNVSVPMSEYDILKGSIHFKGDPLSGEAKLIENKVVGLTPYMSNYFKVWQWVNPDEAKDISETLEKVGNRFDFSKAIIYVRADRFRDDDVAKLDLTRGMQNADLENRLVELGTENVRLGKGLTLWRDRTRNVKELTRILGKFYLAYNQVEQNEILSTATGDNLRGSFANALHSCFHDNKIVDDYLDHVAAFPDSLGKQKEWVDSHCIRLRILIEEQEQGLSDYVQNDGLTPNS